MNEKENRSSTFKEELKQGFISIIIALVLVFCIRTFVIEIFNIDGFSMYPTLENGNKLIVNKFVYKIKNPEKGEIIVFKLPEDDKMFYIKRIIALPGDKVEIKNDVVFVNNKPLKEEYIRDFTKGYHQSIEIPEGQYYVLGDNRSNSKDSRFNDVGCIPIKNIKGKGMVVFWPLERIKALP